MRGLLKGAWPTVITPTLLWLIAVATEEWRIPSAVALTVAVILFFGSFGYLVRIQFSRRKNVKDVSMSWLCAEILGFMLLALAIAAASIIASRGESTPNYSFKRTPNGAA